MKGRQDGAREPGPYAGGQGVRPAIFLDRDGTLIEDRGWLRRSADVVFFPGVFEALRRLQQVAELVVVTNQSGIARGLLQASEAEAVNRHVVECLAAEGVRIRAVYTCPHAREDGCACIKPYPYFALAAAMDLSVSPECSIAVGDHPHDVEFGRRFGGRGVYVLTGHGAKHRASLPEGTAAAVCPDLPAAVPVLLSLIEPVPACYASVEQAADAIRHGDLAAIPTETVYGLAADAGNATAVRRVFAVKGRPLEDPLIVHLADAGDLPSVAAAIPPVARRLAERFWPGPLTLVLPKQPSIPAAVTAGLDTVAVRVPVHPMARRIIRLAGCPVAAPSANRFGGISPTCARHVVRSFGKDLDHVVDGGPCPVGVESTILGFWEGRVWLLRPGGIPVEAIRELAGEVAVYRARGVGDVRAPGSLPRHYAPSTPLVLLEASASALSVMPGDGFLVFGPDAPKGGGVVENLSPSGDPAEAAANLYAALRRLDDAGLKRIVAWLLPEAGLGRTVNDRLQRAAADGNSRVEGNRL